MKPNFAKGLLPAIIVDNKTNDVLMLAYMNEESYQKTLETKKTWFYSRSREELWNKGATSGNTQIVKSIHLDCDNDTILVRVDSQGPACHTGEQSCFFQEVNLFEKEDKDESISDEAYTNILESIMNEVEQRKLEKVENSYTNYLFDKGIDKIGKKLIEEAGEVVIAAKNEDKQEIINEVSDLLYHSFVLMANQKVSLVDVKNELAKRHAKKGNSKGDRPEIKKW